MYDFRAKTARSSRGDHHRQADPRTRSLKIRVDLLVSARWVIPVEPAGAALADHSVAVAGGRIAAVLPTAEAGRACEAARCVELPNHALIPGLVNLHTHASMTLLRGLADDLPLMEWLKEHVWPAEAKHVSPEFVYDGTLLACAEMLRGGITCFNEMYFFPEAAARAALDAGARAALGIIAFEFPTAYAADANDYIAKGLATRDRFRDEPLLSFCMAPHAPYTVSDRTFAKVVTIAEELDLPIHTHLHETGVEIADSLAQHKVRPLERLARLGVLGPRLIAAHAVHVTGQEIETLARHGASVAHCPSSNLKLASGLAPVAAMIGHGVNVGIGTDGAASNNRLDLLEETRIAALLAKAVAGDAEAFPAHQALAAATLNGARALGLEASIGSLVPGKYADLCAISFEDPELSPCYDPVSQLVYAAGRGQVSHVWVAGEPRVERGKLVDFENRSLNSRVLLWQNKLAAETKA
ncbi:MAG TPA: TRZ/ATZ family hydrolase [Burkholderiales bacterium]|nr:TRZ/ATZ family hydrolase [Burkholderiales bacterium]